MAHEFAHIVNGDMRVNTYLAGLLQGLSWLGSAANRLALSAATGTPRAVAAGLSLFAVLLPVTGPALVVCNLGVALAESIRRGACRQQEYRADAAAIQLTRNPDGLAEALKIVGGRQQVPAYCAPAWKGCLISFLPRPAAARSGNCGSSPRTRRLPSE